MDLEVFLARDQIVRQGQICLSPISLKNNGLFPGQYVEISGEIFKVVGDWRVRGTDKEAWVCEADFSKLSGRSVSAKEVAEITLGCDPEFFILEGTRVVPAWFYLPHQGSIGSDGALAELRPKYALDESGLVDNLSELISGITRAIHRSRSPEGLKFNKENFTYRALSFYRKNSAGFHVHLGLPKKLLVRKDRENSEALNYLVRALDWFVSVPTIPLESANERRLGKGLGNYGKPSDYRLSRITLEYRTPGASFLRHPDLAKGMLGLSLAVSREFVSRLKYESKDFSKLESLGWKRLSEMMPIPATGKVRGIIREENPEFALKELNGIKKSIESFSSYPLHKQSIDRFFELAERRERFSSKIMPNWHRKVINGNQAGF